MAPDVDANRVAATKKREQRAEFIRAYFLAFVRSGMGVSVDIPTEEVDRRIVEAARRAWDAIEAEAAKP